MKRIRLFAAAALLIFPTCALAENSASGSVSKETKAAIKADTSSTGEVVVTASRRESSIQKTPITVTAESGKELAKYHITEVDQVAAQVPNFYMQPGVANSSTISLSMRGIGDNGGGFGTTDQPVAFYFDDVYQARPSAVNGEFTDIDRIEVLRGPQGTLFGRNSMIGAVNVITRTPGDTLYGSSSVSYGNYDTFDTKGSIGGPLIQGALAGSLAAVYTNQGTGYMQDIATGKSIDHRDFFGVRGKLHFYPSKTWDDVLTSYYTDSKNDGFVTTPFSGTTYQPLTPDTRETATPIPQYGRTKTLGLDNKITGDFGIFTVKSITGYSKMNDGWYIDLLGGEILGPGDYVEGYGRKSGMSQDQVTQEFQLYGKALDGKLTYITGLYFFHETTDQSFIDQYTFTAAAPFQFEPDGLYSVPETAYRHNSDSYAAYSELNYKLTEKLELVVGARYTWEHKSIAGFVAPNSPASTYASSDNFDSFTPKIGVNYTVSPDTFLYATASEGFKAGGYTSGNSTTIVAKTPFNPETVWAYEIGAKNQFFDRHVRLNIDGYENQFSDILSGAFLPNSGVVVQFNGESYHVLGTEMELSVTPTTGLDIYLNGGLQEAYGFSFIPSVQIKVPPYVPKYSGSTGFRYELPIVNDLRVRFGTDFIFRDHQFGAQGNTPVSEYSYIGELNAEVSLISTQGWQLSAVGKNLTDRYEWQNSLDLISFVGVGSREPQKPRTYSVELSYKF
jgi:iron complex outermembrane receptor protein